MITADHADVVLRTETMVYTALILSVVIISGMVSIAFWTKNFANPVDRLVTGIIAGFLALCGVWVADNLIAVNRALLTESESSALLNILGSSITLILGYYFGRSGRD